MSDLLGGCNAVITGGANGIGYAVARRFAEEGATVTILDVSDESCARACAAADSEGWRLHAVVADVTEEQSLADAMSAAADRTGEPTTVIANAGILDLAPAVDTAASAFRRVLDVNLTGAFLTGKIAARRLTDAGRGGSIVFTSSIAGLRGLPNNAAYSASKFGVIGLAQVFAMELASSQIRVNALCPGQVDTPMLHATAAQKGVTFEQLLERVPLARAASTTEIADGFVYLASPLSRYVTGQAIVIDGGWSVA